MSAGDGGVVSAGEGTAGAAAAVGGTVSNELTAEAAEFGAVVKAALLAAGGDDLVSHVHQEPERRLAVDVALAEVGAWELDVRSSHDELEAAAALCRSAGYWAVPYPVAERLCRPADLDVAGLSVVAANPAAPIAGLDLPWAAVDLDGRRFTATPSSAGARDLPLVVGLDLAPIDNGGGADLALALVLPCWTLLGMLDRAIELTCRYALDRQQFDQALAEFQGVQFQLTDAEVERAGVEELAKYALWAVEVDGPDAVADALALRLAAIEAADVTFRVCHQVHGAIGFCDETVLSWLSRASQPIRRLPLALTATATALTGLVGGGGLSGLFDEVAP